MPPPNDLPANAELLPVGAYWGVASGTTVGATESLDGWGSQDVFFYWPDLPPGLVYVFIRPRPPYPSDAYLEGDFFAKMPAGVTGNESSELIGWDNFSADDPDARGMFQVRHPGGPLTFAVLTYTPEEYDFDFGWGHELDPDPSHWDFAVSPQVTRSAGVNEKRYINNYDGVAESGSPDLPANSTLINCAFDNARRGAFTGSPATTCAPQPDGPGQLAGGSFGDVGMLLFTNADPGSDQPGPYTRTDHCLVNETLVGIGFRPFHVTDPPETWESHYLPDLNWGWQYQGSELIDGDATLTVDVSDFDLVPTDFPGVYNEPCTPIVVWLPPAMASFDRPFVPLYLLPAPYATLPDAAGTSTVTFAGWKDWCQVDGNAMYLAWVSREARDGEIPTPQDVRAAAQRFGSRERSISIAASYDYKEPDYRIYRGFPLVPPEPGAWHIGRTAVGAW